jgi:hypothetical protein
MYFYLILTYICRLFFLLEKTKLKEIIGKRKWYERVQAYLLRFFQKYKI